ncbi:beta-glucoside-specific PTS transporter subunit IIABC [Absiella sp. AM29-15]|uniref:beta-glucoside-specific PTS transporter subunit IIABC n=1 Tax=Absiella sp. AM29-15 TaxID=2292278 RepID=UPI000E4008F2|nr:beta-glucoside-specific PTS transporter subunit IIABC [Absiella sp. AM29-15]RGC46917.1 PTS beta-glucoside transporter subunit EIIBCA [Absiella sp. AM29-15]
MDTNKLTKEILENVGGKNNIKDVTHCFTRLRFVLKDESKAEKDIINHLEGVIQVVVSGGQFQVVLGSKVTKVYDALLPMVDLDENARGESEEKGNLFNRVLQVVSKMFTPLIPAIAASGLISGALTAVKLLAAQNGTDISTNDTYILLYAASQIIFYFMPIFLGYTAAKALKCNEFIAMTIGGFLCYPQIDAIIQDASTATSIFGLPVIKGAWTIGEATKAFSYTGSVIPILLAVFVLVYLERVLKKFVPQILQIILVPGVSLIVMVPLTLSLLGPVGVWVGNVIQTMYTVLMDFNAILGGAVIGGLWGVFVIFGAHRALLPIGLNDIAVSGKQNLLAFAGAANFSQGGAALGVMLKTKSQDMKGVAAAATISAAVVGITEPAIYGCNLRLKKPMIAAIICGAIGGGIMGLGGVYGDAFANNGVLTIFTYAAGGMTKFAFYIIGCLVAFFGAAALTYVMGFEDVEEKKSTVKAVTNSYEVKAPVLGEVVQMSEVNDEAFASEALGKGIAIYPEKGEVIAPEDCTVTFVYPTKHAIGLTFDNGVELLIHIGINTVELNGNYFTQNVEAGTHVEKGTCIVSFDIDKIKAEGYDPTVMVIVSNTPEYASVEGLKISNANADTSVIGISI